MWRLDDPQGNESAKIKYDIVPYTRGKGLDIGCGPYKTYAHFTGVDNLHHAHEFGWDMRPDVVVDDATNLNLFANQSMDFVFSSHLLEHIEEAKKALKEWWRLIKPGGHLVLYLPHEDLYPKCGTEGANPDHKHDLSPAKVTDWMIEVGSWELVVSEDRDNDNGPGEYGNEYSFYQVYKKINHNKKKPVNRTVKKVEGKTACVVRYGGFGDMIQASTAIHYLDELGYKVTVMTTPRGKDLLKANPHVSKFIVQDTDQVPNNELSNYWSVWEKKFDRFVNLSESVEGSLLAIPGRTMYKWPLETRRELLNHNYLEMTHSIAGLPKDKFRAHFHPTGEEVLWAEHEDKRINPSCKPVILWSLAGSSVHKTWPWLDQVLARIMLETDCIVVLTGDEFCQILEAGWENEPRVIEKSGRWSIRQSLTFAQRQADLVIGTETGLLNAVGMEEVTKIITLSHSSVENLTKHWKNTYNLLPKTDCYPCHQMHYGFTACRKDDETGCAQCQVDITPDQMWEAIIDWNKDRLKEVV